MSRRSTNPTEVIKLLVNAVTDNLSSEKKAQTSECTS